MQARHLGAAAALLLAAPLTTLNAQAPAIPKDSIQADAKFIRRAVADNQLEVQLGQLAQNRASDPMVKKFGQRMVMDHQKLVKQWTDLASDHGMPLKPALGEKQQKKLDRLGKVEGKAFDREYMITMIKAHSKDAAHLKAETDEARSEPVRKMAAYELPIVQDHLLSAQAAAKEVGVDSAMVARSRAVAESE